MIVTLTLNPRRQDSQATDPLMILNHQLYHAKRDCVTVSCQTMYSIDCKIPTVLHILYWYVPASGAVDMLRCVVDRIKNHRTNIIQWRANANWECECLISAATNQRLKKKKKQIVQDQPYFADHVAPSSLWERVGRGTGMR